MGMPKFALVLLLAALCQSKSLAASPAANDRPNDSTLYGDIIVYGGTSSGVVAAVQAARLGRSVILVCPDKVMGGLSSSGLGWTDTGDKSVIGGVAREFYHRVWRHYQDPGAWKWERREDYGNRGQGTEAIDAGRRTQWIFEPHVAETVFEEMLAEDKIRVFRDEWLDRENGVSVNDKRIITIRCLSGKSFSGEVFVDATYEGDLLAAAGADYHVGREGQEVYGERWNGVQLGVKHHSHYFAAAVDPYMVPGDPSSGLLPWISPDPPGMPHKGDRRIQAYCYRMCLSNHPDNRLPFPKPERYDPDAYELLLRVFDTGWRDVFHKFDKIPNRKTDTNNHGPFSTDHIGANYDYPEASYERRREILDDHCRYQQGLMYFLANDPRVPKDVRSRMSEWGLAADEFSPTGGWPHQIYVREARRLVGEYVMTEHDCLLERRTPHSVGMGSYSLDSHNVQRYVTPEGTVQNEGDVGVKPPGPYAIAYGSLTPRRDQVENLLAPVCVSASHIAYGSIRMEPVFMILGHSAATAADLAIEAGQSVQDVDYAVLRDRLLAEGQVLSTSPSDDAERGRSPRPSEVAR
jgi:hypothetical protein